MAAMSKIQHYGKFSFKSFRWISEGNKVFVRVHATANNMDIFGHYFESSDEGKTKVMMTFDDIACSMQ